MIVIDASVLAPALSDDSDEGDHLRQRLRGQRLTAPELIDLEVQSVLRSAVRRGLLGERRARLALEDLASAPLHHAPHRPSLSRARGPLRGRPRPDAATLSGAVRWPAVAQ